jgi:hypothetical protein
MAQDIHAASNAAIANYLNKEVTVTMTRGQLNDLAILVNQTLLNEHEVLSNEHYLYLVKLHNLLNRGN